jgi:UDP-N-acetylmuramyl pentapeptide phosphotransferase/UDP-N-acetylglucosamine-1-phosphate transferase
MRLLAIVGVALILLGTAALAYQGVTYFTRDTVVDVGPVHVEADRPHTIPLPPVIGGIAIVLGLVLTVAGYALPNNARASNWRGHKVCTKFLGEARLGFFVHANVQSRDF